MPHGAQRGCAQRHAFEEPPARRNEMVNSFDLSAAPSMIAAAEALVRGAQGARQKGRNGVLLCRRSIQLPGARAHSRYNRCVLQVRSFAGHDPLQDFP
jgi:hypothetical protein